MERDTLKSAVALILSALIWGMGFVAQRYGTQFVGPLLFAGVRTLLAALTILLIIAITRKAPRRGTGWKPLIKGGVVYGIVLFFAQGFQQLGVVYTTASKAAFLTALYIVLVPIIGIFLKKRTHWNTWISVVIAAAGLYFLSITTSLTILPGDTLLLVSAFMWATHILVTDHYVAPLDQQGIYKLITIQFITCSALSLALAPFVDMKLVPIALTADAFIQVLPALLYFGCVSAGAGFTLQAIGQKHINPSAAGIILSLEAVFGAIGGALILGERLSSRELLGCALMLGAVILSQIPVARKKRENLLKGE
ncbi:MAG: DMT family transporter [Clostridiales Family XIII bacterium]|jgi:drug/metabolite transporter (DMT)-like permease|nr:DMT family transporter [Clostridiales Family XIII bacterium]